MSGRRLGVGAADQARAAVPAGCGGNELEGTCSIQLLVRCGARAGCYMHTCVWPPPAAPQRRVGSAMLRWSDPWRREG